jgi:hypothetical protein
MMQEKRLFLLLPQQVSITRCSCPERRQSASRGICRHANVLTRLLYKCCHHPTPDLTPSPSHFQRQIPSSQPMSRQRVRSRPADRFKFPVIYNTSVTSRMFCLPTPPVPIGRCNRPNRCWCMPMVRGQGAARMRPHTARSHMRRLALVMTRKMTARTAYKHLSARLRRCHPTPPAGAPGPAVQRALPAWFCSHPLLPAAEAELAIDLQTR